MNYLSMSSTSQLKFAISSSDNETVSYLLGKMDIIAVNMKEDGEAALHVACDEKNNEALDLLLSKTNIDVNVKDEIGQTPLYKSCKINNFYAIGKLLDRPEIYVNARANSIGSTPLHIACIQDNLQVAVKLLESPRIDVNAKLPNGRTPLHCACMKNIPVVVQKLLASPGIDVNVRDAEGITPLMECVRCCNEEALKILLEDPRVNLDIKDKQGRALKVKVRTSSYYSCLDLIKTERMRRDTEAVKQELTSHAGSIAEEIVFKLLEEMVKEVTNRKKVDQTALHVAGDKKNHETRDLLLVKTGNEKGKVELELTNQAGSMVEVASSTLELKSASSSKVKDETALHMTYGKKNHEAQDLVLVKTAIENGKLESEFTSEAESITEVNLLNMAATSQLKSSTSSKDKDGTALDDNDKHDEALDLTLAENVIEGGEVGQEQTIWAGIIGRHNVKIEKINIEIGMEEGKCKTNMDMRKKKMKDLATKYKEERSLLENNQDTSRKKKMEDMVKKHKDELSLLEKNQDILRKQKMEDLARNHKEELSLLEKNQRHGIIALQDTLAKEEHDEQRYIDRLKEHRHELAHELEKLTNDASSEGQNVNNLHEQEIETVKKSEEQMGVLLNKVEYIQEEENVQNQMNEVTKDKTEQKKEKKSKPYCSLASCPNKGRHKCSRCKAVYYCHQDCLSEDWPHHKMFCDYVYEANKVPEVFNGKNSLDIENTSCKEEVE